MLIKSTVSNVFAIYSKSDIFFIIAYFLCHTSWFQKLAWLFLWQIWLKQNSCFTDFNSFWYFCFHWNNDNIKNSLNQTAIFSSSNKCNFHIDQIKERLVKHRIKMLGIYGIGKKKAESNPDHIKRYDCIHDLWLLFNLNSRCFSQTIRFIISNYSVLEYWEL